MFEARNESNAVVATHNTITYGLTAKGTVTLTNNAYNGQYATQSGAAQVRSQVLQARYAPFVAGLNSLVAFRPVYNTSVGIGFDPNGNRAFVGIRNPENPNGQTEPVVEYFVFNPVVAPRASGVGLEIYRADGSVAMANVAKPMKIVAVSALDAPGVPAVTASTNGNYAICYGVPFPRVNFSAVYDPQTGGFYYGEGVAMYRPPAANGFAAGTIQSAQIRLSQGTPPYGSADQQKVTAMLINVQGL